MAIDNSGAPSNYGAKKSSEYRGSTFGFAAKKKKPVTKKTVVTSGTKVSQKTINNIKSMGMAKTLEALKSIGQPGSRNVPASKEFIEGARRMYGTRVDKYLPAKSSSADAARGRATTAAKPKMGSKTVMAPKASNKPAAKKSNNNSNILKATLGTAAAVGVLAASKGRGASLASKLSPAMGKAASSPIGKAIFGTGEKLTTKGTAMAGRMTAKAGKPVSQAQYDAMRAAASARGIKLSGPDAARAGATAAAKKKAASTVTKKKAAGASGASNKKNK